MHYESVTFSETSKVNFFDLSPKDIRACTLTGEPMDKAGSYGTQGIGSQMVERIEGDFFNIMGLPMHRISKELSKIIALIDRQNKHSKSSLFSILQLSKAL